METIKDKAENLTEHVGDYIETYLMLTAIKATDKAAGFASEGITTLLVTMLAFFFLLFAGMGLGWWLGQKLDNMLAGFAIIAGAYALLAMIVLAFRKKLLLPLIKNYIIRIAYE